MSGVNGWLTSLSEYIGGMSDELDNAKAENARLRAMRDTWAENDARLRELVRDMWELGFGDNSGANNAWEWHERADELEGRMSELGIGVGADA